MAYQIINHNCLSLNDLLAYHLNKLSQQSLNRIENHAAVCDPCFDKLYNSVEQLKEMAKQLRRFVQYE